LVEGGAFDIDVDDDVNVSMMQGDWWRVYQTWVIKKLTTWLMSLMTPWLIHLPLQRTTMRGFRMDLALTWWEKVDTFVQWFTLPKEQCLSC
jgi:hypothetical protein